MRKGRPNGPALPLSGKTTAWRAANVTAVDQQGRDGIESRACKAPPAQPGGVRCAA
jgi:hypothetical protein